jgi:hypothetical protein
MSREMLPLEPEHKRNPGANHGRAQKMAENRGDFAIVANQDWPLACQCP